MTRQRKRDIRKRQRRHRKVRYLRARLERTHDLKEREELIAKLHKVAPNAPVSLD
jgi:hypothetical protein